MSLLGRGGFSEVYKVCGGCLVASMSFFGGNRYLLMSLLGCGGFSEVYKVGALVGVCGFETCTCTAARNGDGPAFQPPQPAIAISNLWCLLLNQPHAGIRPEQPAGGGSLRRDEHLCCGLTSIPLLPILCRRLT